MTKIFISYRRKDSEYAAGRIKDRLESRFGAGTVFFDVSDIKGGAEFEKEIVAFIEQASALLVIVGMDWHQSFRWSSGVDASPMPESQVDYVHYEIRKGFESGTPIIPVLLKGVDKIAGSAIPEDLRRLEGLHALKLNNESFDTDFERITDAIKNIERQARARRWRQRFERLRFSWFSRRKPSSGSAAVEGKGRYTSWLVPGWQALHMGSRVGSESSRHHHVGRFLDFKSAALRGQRADQKRLLIELRDLSLSYRQADTEEQVLKRVTLCVFVGNFLAVSGPDARGRQGLLDILGLRESPTSGSCFVGGRELADLSVAEKDSLRLSGIRCVARAPQISARKAGFLSAYFGQERLLRMSVEALLRNEAERVKDFDPKICDPQVQIALKAFRLDAVARARLCDLDPEQFQRFFFAKAVVTAPAVLVVDMAAILLGGTRLILNSLQTLNEQLGLTVICEGESHFKHSSARASQQVHLEDGRINKLGIKCNDGNWKFVLNHSP